MNNEPQIFQFGFRTMPFSDSDLFYSEIRNIKHINVNIAFYRCKDTI